jgi:hypothetical protein
MAIVKGDDFPDGFGRVEGFAVAGAGAPGLIRDQGGDAVPVNTVGVYGAVGDADSVNEVIDDIANNFDQKVTAGVAGAFVPKPPEGVGAAPDAFGFLGGNDLVFNEPTGVYGESSRQGVVGISKGAGVAVLGRALGSGLAGRFDGKIQVVGGPVDVFEGDINVTGSVSVTNDLLLKNGDVAERFEVNESTRYHPGMLMVIGENGALEPCTSSYDKRAIGVISGAATRRPAVTLAAFEPEAATVPIALVGTVFCLVDADLGSIKAGDLVTSSETPGHAMRATDPIKSFGAIVGKALAPLGEGRALVPIVISLQ